MKFLSSIAVVVVMLFIISGLFTVQEYERAIVLRLGKIESDFDGNPKIRTPGLNFKIPFVTIARVFDIRIQTLDIDSSRIVTQNKKDLLVDYYIKWKITDLPKFYTSTGGNIIRVHTLLEQKANDGIRAEFGKRTIQEVVSGERSDIMDLLLKQVDKSVAGLGIDVIDVRIKRVDLPTEVSSTVFARMRAERARVATEHRAKGRSESEAIRAKADAEVTVILATAESESKKIRGEADAIAAKIYAESYNRDPDFYAFYRSTTAYKNIFSNGNDFLVLMPDDNRFFKYFGRIDTNRK
ncbi:MAG: protease modulator HflC [Legionellales bacterium]|nr:protease modulator HflC [Legionellales bacterium]